MLYYTDYLSPLGNIMIASNSESILGLWFEGQKYFASTISDTVVLKKDLPVLIRASEWLQEYFKGYRPDIKSLPLAPEGSVFRLKVWEILKEIPYGTTVTYGDIAREMCSGSVKKSMPFQAVGGAVGHNPISVIIPCHRVVGAGGKLTGYAGGIDKKIKLLRLEGVNIDVRKNSVIGT